MVQIHSEKVETLYRKWVEYEHWWQSDRASGEAPPVDVPGYRLIQPQGPEPWGMYRDWLALLFADLRGARPIFEDLSEIIEACDRHHAEAMAEFRATHRQPSERFLDQWGNLFSEMYWDGLTHNSVNLYARKYEVEWPLVFLAQLRGIQSNGVLDQYLSRFRDRHDKLKKGVVANYIVSGLAGFPNLQAAVKKAYVPAIRNAISHNEYAITEAQLRSLDASVVLSADEFRDHLFTLQEVQNAVLWATLQLDHDYSRASNLGIVAAGWGRTDPDGAGVLILYQLLPFVTFDPQGAWLNRINVRMEGDKVYTDYGGPHPIQGPRNSELTSLLRETRSRGRIRCIITGIMPCIHQGEHSVHHWPTGTFCETEPGSERMIPIAIGGL